MTVVISTVTVVGVIGVVVAAGRKIVMVELVEMVAAAMTMVMEITMLGGNGVYGGGDGGRDGGGGSVVKVDERVLSY